MTCSHVLDALSFHWLNPECSQQGLWCSVDSITLFLQEINFILSKSWVTSLGEILVSCYVTVLKQ